MERLDDQLPLDLRGLLRRPRLDSTDVRCAFLTEYRRPGDALESASARGPTRVKFALDSSTPRPEQQGTPK